MAGLDDGPLGLLPHPFSRLRAAVDVAILVNLMLPDVKRAFAA
jgi:hypothetical protein